MTQLSETKLGDLSRFIGHRRSAEYTLRRYYVDSFLISVAGTISLEVCLDVGGTRTDKRGFFNIDEWTTQAVYLNLSAKKKPHMLGDAHHLPFSEERFDSIVYSEVFEHLRYPELALSEAHRVLRPGGNLVICVPFLYRIHGDPCDYLRFTDYMWKDLLSLHGFEIIKLERQGAFYSVIHDCLKLFVNARPRNRVTLLFARLLLTASQRWVVHRDQQARMENDSFLTSFTTGFGIVARKRDIHS